MRPPRFRPLLSALFLATVFAPSALRATGDFYEEPLQTLGDYLRLDQLPAKSVAQIQEETAKPGPEAEAVNYSQELQSLAKKPGKEALASIDKMIMAARSQAALTLLNLLND